MQRFHSFFKFFLLCILCSDILLGKVKSAQKPFMCSNNEQCKTILINSICRWGQCKCEEDKLLSSDATKCLEKAKKFGSPCEDNVQCSQVLTNGGICHENKCSCKKGYHYLKGSCWKNVGLHEECVMPEQCYSSYEYVGFECRVVVENNFNTPKVCQCRPQYYQRMNSDCRRKRSTGESCNLDSDCVLNVCEGMTCRTSISKSNNTYEAKAVFHNLIPNPEKGIFSRECPTGTFLSGEKCVLELGMPCSKNSECDHILNALCLDNLYCACDPVLFVADEDNRKCLRVPRAKIDDISKASCKKNPECGVFGPHSYCENKKRCNCEIGTYFDPETKFCWPISSLNEKCWEDKDCHPSETHAHCARTKLSGKICLCQNGYHQKGLKCIPKATKVGDPCESHEECFFPNSVCNASDICECKEHHYFENGKCEPGVGSACSDDKCCAHLKNTECKIGNTEMKQCLCIENHTNSKDKKYCLPVADYKQACQESFQCEFRLGPFGVCKNQICGCREGAHYSNGNCHKSKYVGQSCTKKLDCFSGNDTKSTICLKGFCSCNYNYELDKNVTCIRTKSASTVKFFSMSLMSLVLFFIVRET